METRIDGNGGCFELDRRSKMSSKLAIKTSKSRPGDRPKSSDKISGHKSSRKSKDAGTPPENALSPVLSAGHSDPDGRSTPLTDLDREIQLLKINPNELKSSVPPSPVKAALSTTKVLVKKKIPASEIPKPCKSVTVACRAPSNAEIKLPNPEDYPGLRTYDGGRVVPHSILGSVEDFIEKASQNGDSGDTVLRGSKSAPSPWPDDRNHETAYDKQKRTRPIKVDETRALDNWERQMKMRKREQKHIADSMRLEEDLLLMNQDGDFRVTQEERTLIDRAIPAMGYGKGYRVGSEFWKQVENVGGEGGIQMTLTQTERGYAPPVEHIGRPDTIRKSMGTDWTETRRIAHIHCPWLKSEYLDRRRWELRNVINEMVPHRPYLDGLEVIGQSLQKDHETNNNEIISEQTSQVPSVTEYEEELPDPLAEYEDVIPLPIFGPSLTINGHSAQWNGSVAEKENNTGLKMRLQFEAETGLKATNSIDITNDGTAAIYYSWRKIQSKDPFGIKMTRPLQRFFFDTRNGVILPTDSIKIPFSFKSSNAGIFSETWQLETQPILCGGAPMLVILRGVSTEEDLLAEQRKELEEELERRQNDTFIKELVEEIFNGVRSPPRPSTPIDSYITEEELFARQNRKMNFNTEATTNLKAFHEELNPDDTWDMSIDTLLKEARVTEDEEIQESLLQRLNEDVQMFSFLTDEPVRRELHNSCYQLFCEAMDAFYVKAGKLRTIMGLPEKEFMVEVVVEEVVKKPKKAQLETQKAPDKKQGTPDKKLDSKKKDRPASSRGKSSGNQKSRGKEMAAASVASTKQVDPPKIPAYRMKKEPRGPLTPEEKRYNENMYIQMYDILGALAVKIENILGAERQIGL